MALTGRLYGCPVELALGLLGGKWKTIILSRLKQSPMRYGEIRAIIPELSDKVLTQRLRELVEVGLVAGAPDPAGHVRYGLTERGRSLRPVLESLYAWGEATAAEQGARFRPAPPGPRA